MYCKREVELGAGWEAGAYDIFTRGGAAEAGNHTSIADSTSMHYTTTQYYAQTSSAQDGSILPRGQAGPATVHCLGQITRGHIKDQL